MARTELPKYRVGADPPGMQIDGMGVVPQGHVIETPASFTPRASMFPLNAAARAAFDRRRAQVKSETEKLCKEEGVSPQETAALVKAALEKVGPLPEKKPGLARKRRRPDVSGIRVDPGDKPATDDDDASGMLAEGDLEARASDS